MFTTINIYLRFALIALFLGGGLILAFVYSFWYAFPLILIGLIFVAGYIFLGTVQSTAQLVQEEKFAEAEKRIALTWKPEWLYKTNRAFYYMIQGTLAMGRKDTDAAEKWLTQAQNLDLPSDNEKAMVYLQITEPMMKEQMKQFEKAITNRGQAKHLQGMRGRKGGYRRMRK